ncbi:MAG: hypothetical protein ACFCVD_22160 [Nodosilinea sp.]
MGEPIKSHDSQRWAFVRTILAPLFMISLAFHGALLLLPTPSKPEPSPEELEAEAEAEADAPVDLLSISSLATTEPEQPPDVPAEPAASPPPATAAAPQVPSQPVVPETYPEERPPEAPSPEDQPPADFINDSATDPPVTGFDPNRQAQVVGGALGAIGREPGKSNFDLTDQFPGDIWDLYISQWPAAQRQCFFTAIDQASYTLPPQAADLRYLSRNIQLVEQQDIPRTFAGQAVQPLGAAYCNQSFFEVVDDGTPILWVSLVPVSPGGSTTLVIFWTADPRI